MEKLDLDKYFVVLHKTNDKYFVIEKSKVSQKNWDKRQNELIECFRYDEKNKVVLLYPELFDISELKQIWLKLT